MGVTVLQHRITFQRMLSGLCKSASCSSPQSNCSSQFLRDKCHLLLKNILTNTESKGKTSKSKYAKWTYLLGKRIPLRVLQLNNHDGDPSFKILSFL